MQSPILIEKTMSSVVIEWIPQSFDSTYIVLKAEGTLGEFKAIAQTQGVRASIKELVKGTTYMFQVYEVNPCSSGTAEPSPELVVDLKEPPPPLQIRTSSIKCNFLLEYD
jgi:hypothetical protein